MSLKVRSLFFSLFTIFLSVFNIDNIDAANSIMPKLSRSCIKAVRGIGADELLSKSFDTSFTPGFFDDDGAFIPLFDRESPGIIDNILVSLGLVEEWTDQGPIELMAIDGINPERFPSPYLRTLESLTFDVDALPLGRNRFLFVNTRMARPFIVDFNEPSVTVGPSFVVEKRGNLRNEIVSLLTAERTQATAKQRTVALEDIELGFSNPVLRLFDHGTGSLAMAFTVVIKDTRSMKSKGGKVWRLRGLAMFKLVDEDGRLDLKLVGLNVEPWVDEQKESPLGLHQSSSPGEGS